MSKIAEYRAAMRAAHQAEEHAHEMKPGGFSSKIMTAHVTEDLGMRLDFTVGGVDGGVTFDAASLPEFGKFVDWYLSTFVGEE